MGRIEYRKGDMLSDPPKGVYLLHACNSRGVWGRGIAEQFKRLHSKAFRDYNSWCNLLGNDFEGEIQIVGEHDHPVICFVTSAGYAKDLSPPDVILRNTQRCIDQLQVSIEEDAEIWSPKFNAGLFRTPWEGTEAIIESFLSVNPKVKWVVWEL